MNIKNSITVLHKKLGTDTHKEELFRRGKFSFGKDGLDCFV